MIICGIRQLSTTLPPYLPPRTRAWVRTVDAPKDSKGRQRTPKDGQLCYSIRQAVSTLVSRGHNLSAQSCTFATLSSSIEIGSLDALPLCFLISHLSFKFGWPCHHQIGPNTLSCRFQPLLCDDAGCGSLVDSSTPSASNVRTREPQPGLAALSSRARHAGLRQLSEATPHSQHPKTAETRGYCGRKKRAI